MFNNAGVCVVGSDRVVLEHNLDVNFYGALRVMEECLPAMTYGRSGVKSAVGTSTATTAATTVVWVSSGDGELCFLGSKWRRLLGGAESLEVRRTTEEYPLLVTCLVGHVCAKHKLLLRFSG